jgi:hypothetical protein
VKIRHSHSVPRPSSCDFHSRTADPGILKPVHALCLALFMILGCSSSLFAQTLNPVLVQGSISNRCNIVFLSEGYTAGQLPQFRVDATNASLTLLARSPFSEYRSYFNVYEISVASAQSGSDHPAYGSYRSTYFNSSYDAVSDRLVTIPPNAFDTDYAHGQGKIDALLQALIPQCRLAVLLVNDLSPGGSDGSGATAITYRGAGLMQFLAHEVGHVMANLGDEYTEPNPGYPDTEEPNTTRQTNNVKWAAWVPSGTPIPTPPTADFFSTVGVFEGAHYHSTGWYRPKFDCTMNHPSFPDYCEVCRESLVLALTRLVRFVDAFRPAAQTLTLPSTSGPQLFELDLVQPSTHNVNVQWLLDSTPVPGATNTTCTIFPQDLNAGQHTVAAVIHDPTALVRNDPTAVLTQTIAWQLQVTQLRLDSPRVLPGGQFVFHVSGSAPAGFVVQSSPDLLSWRDASTNTLTLGNYWFTNPAPLGPREYFRALLR